MEIVFDIVMSTNADAQIVIELRRMDGHQTSIRVASRTDSLAIARAIILAREDAGKQIRILAEKHRVRGVRSRRRAVSGSREEKAE